MQPREHARFARFVLSGWFVLALMIAAPARSEPIVELYTMGPGEALFTKFGHAALCVVDADLPAGGLCYNYGTTDFSRPVGLGWDVMRGRAKFWVSVSDRVSMLVGFQMQDRSMYRQVLPLTQQQSEELVTALQSDALPENRDYIYSHFLDNCSTRPRDIIDAATLGGLRRTEIPSTRTYRDYAREGLASSHWSLVPAGDLILGRWVDQNIDPFAAMFIPEVLAEAVQAELGVAPETVYERQAPLAVGGVNDALFRFWIFIAVVGALAWITGWGRLVAAGVVVMLGIIVWAGALVSPWPELRINELSLVFVPFDVFLLRRTMSRRYAKVRLVMLAAVALLAAIGVFVQPLWPYWVLATTTVASFWWRQRKDILAT
jgi:hypothetical protein